MLPLIRVTSEEVNIPVRSVTFITAELAVAVHTPAEHDTLLVGVFRITSAACAEPIAAHDTVAIDTKILQTRDALTIGPIGAGWRSDKDNPC
jgi:hypothetical protein